MTASADRNIAAEIEIVLCVELWRACGKNQEFARLQTGEKFVQLGVAGGDTGNAFAFAEDFLEALEVVADDVFYGNEAGFYAVFSKRKDGGLGVIENGVRTVFGFKRSLLDVVCSVN